MKQNDQALRRDPFSLSQTQPIVVRAPAAAALELPDRTSKARKGPDDKNLSEEAQEIVDIRKSLGMTQADFALALGEPKERLVNIENSRLKKVPEQMLQIARQMKSEESDARVQPLSDLSKLTMSQIIDRWCGLAKAASDEELALLLGISRTAMKRWRSESNRPSMNDLLRYENLTRRLQGKRGDTQS